uniref:Uncharacterized protein Tam-RVIP4 n=1 Tax=Vitis hybrid cultivar TaxID=241073 RepID=E3WHD9_9ROSI|nr:hypothetical protein [Vitis hybrid cultivar]
MALKPLLIEALMVGNTHSTRRLVQQLIISLIMKTLLVLCAALGFFLVTLKADAGRVTLEETYKDLNRKVGVGANDHFKTIAGTMDNQVASSGDGESSNGSEDADSHRVFPELTNPRGNQPEKSNPGRRG